MMHLGTGHLRDTYDFRDLRADQLIGTRITPSPPNHEGVLRFVGKIADQGATNSCVGQAISQATFSRMGAIALEQKRPSPFFIYWLARVEDGLQSADRGSRPRSAFRGLSRSGYCAESTWPGDEIITPMVAPPWDAMQCAIDQRTVGYYRIVSGGDMRCNEIRAALSQSFPVCIALMVDQSYQDTTGEWSGPVPGKPSSGHYVCATHYDEGGLYHVGSYGTSWGKKGFCRVAWSAIGRPDITSDIWVVNYAATPS